MQPGLSSCRQTRAHLWLNWLPWATVREVGGWSLSPIDAVSHQRTRDYGPAPPDVGPALCRSVLAFWISSLLPRDHYKVDIFGRQSGFRTECSSSACIWGPTLGLLARVNLILWYIYISSASGQIVVSATHLSDTYNTLPASGRYCGCISCWVTHYSLHFSFDRTPKWRVRGYCCDSTGGRSLLVHCEAIDPDQ